MRPKFDFCYGVTAGPFGTQEYTHCAVLCCDGEIYKSIVVRDSRDQPNRRLARFRALEKALLPLPRVQRIEIWKAFHARAQPKPASVHV